jgi:hypothetical protein
VQHQLLILFLKHLKSLMKESISSYSIASILEPQL